MGPNELGWFEAALEALGETGLSPLQQHQAFLLLIGHVRSHAEFRVAETRGPLAAQWVEEMTQVLGSSGESCPALTVAIGAGAFNHSQDGGIDFGLQCILEGIQKLAGKAKRRRRPLQ